MERWRRDLYVLWACSFIVQGGFSLIMPFLPLYLEELHVRGSAVQMWSGLIFSANFVVMAIVSPIWGALSDKVGRKPMMLRSAFGMGIVVWFMGLVVSPWQLLGLRLFQGVASGFYPAAVAYIASVSPREHAGYALGMLATGQVAGTIMGPLAGGVLAKVMGYRPIFFVTSLSCLISGLIVMLTIRERFTPIVRPKSTGLKGEIALIRQHPVVLGVAMLLFLNMVSILTAEPVLTLYLRTLKAPQEWVSLLSGLVFSITGVATLMVAPRMGRLSDRIGSRKVLTVCLSGAALMYVLQGFAASAWQMVAMRFVLGLFTGGLMPAANGLLARSVPREIQGRIFGLTSSAIFLGNTVGPILGGGIAAWFGMRSVFPVTGVLLLVTLAWVRTGVRDHVSSTPASA